ncbi:hypothetical protein FGRMN_699 [Fusarium graminum]|nr:hypothetical protein FGRMN_699 [Fusarium graminum]
MESVNTNTQAIWATDGLLAALIYLNETSLMSATQQDAPFNSPNPASLACWMSVHYIQTELGHYWERLNGLDPTWDLPGLDSLLKSCPGALNFYEEAILAFRDILIGSKPDSLTSIFALCSLSYTASCHLYKHNRLIGWSGFPDINMWKNAIRDPEQRQTFTRLMESIWPDVPLIPDSYNQPWSHSIVEDTMLLDASFNTFSNGFEEVVDYLNPIDTNRTEVEPASESQLLQISTIVSNLTCFLEECCGSIKILSGRGLTAENLYSCIAFNRKGPKAKDTIKVSYIQPLRKRSLQSGIPAKWMLSIADKFVDIGYLQSVAQVQAYLLSVGFCLATDILAKSNNPSSRRTESYSFHPTWPWTHNNHYGAFQDMFGPPSIQKRPVSRPAQILSPAFTDGQSNTSLSQAPDQIMLCVYPANSLDAPVQLVQPQYSQLPDLQRSAVITNITRFLRNCGEILQTPSRNDTTTEDLHLDATFHEELKHIKTTYLRRLRRDEVSNEASAQAIFFIVERFVDHGRLRSVDEVPGYMVLVGITLPYDQSILQYLRSVHAFADMAEKSLEKLQFDICQNELSTNFNLKRYHEALHGPAAANPNLMCT